MSVDESQDSGTGPAPARHIGATAGELEGLAEQARALAEGQVTSTALVRRSLERIEATQSSVNAFRRVRAEAAMAEAAEADRRLAAGERLPLLGVPVAVKDDTDVAGEPTAFGCRRRVPAQGA